MALRGKSVELDQPDVASASAVASRALADSARFVELGLRHDRQPAAIEPVIVGHRKGGDIVDPDSRWPRLLDPAGQDLVAGKVHDVVDPALDAERAVGPSRPRSPVSNQRSPATASPTKWSATRSLLTRIRPSVPRGTVGLIVDDFDLDERKDEPRRAGLASSKARVRQPRPIRFPTRRRRSSRSAASSSRTASTGKRRRDRAAAADDPQWLQRLVRRKIVEQLLQLVGHQSDHPRAQAWRNAPDRAARSFRARPDCPMPSRRASRPGREWCRFPSRRATGRRASRKR